MAGTLAKGHRWSSGGPRALTQAGLLAVQRSGQEIYSFMMLSIAHGYQMLASIAKFTMLSSVNTYSSLKSLTAKAFGPIQEWKNMTFHHQKEVQ